MLEQRDKIIAAFRGGTFSSEHLKKSDDAAYKYVLKDINKFIQKIKSLTEKVNLSFFREFFGLSPVHYANYLTNLKNTKKKKKTVTEAENIISALKDTIKKMSEKEKKRKNVNETIEIIEKILDDNKNDQRFFSVASEVDKGKPEPKPKGSIVERIKLRRQKSKK